MDVNDVAVTGVSWAANPGLGTAGGDAVTITGRNFGPCARAGGGGGGSATKPIVSATYANGVDGLVYNTTACSVVAGANTRVVCLAAPGVGSGHVWTVHIDARHLRFDGGERCSRVWVASSYPHTTSYAPPVVTAVAGATALAGSGDERFVPAVE